MGETRRIAKVFPPRGPRLYDFEESESAMRRIALIYALALAPWAQAPAQLFVRGDANEDSSLDIADPVKVLLYLFASAGAIRCEDAADGNDDGALDVSDAVFLLRYLFLGGLPPPAPFPAPGSDPTSDLLCCATSCDADVAGIWCGTFVDSEEGEVVVCFEVEETPEGALIARGLESLGNEILAGEVFVWAGGGERRLGFDYFTSFDAVLGDFRLSSDGLRMEDGQFTTTSGTEGTFSMVRISRLPSPPRLAAGRYRIVFAVGDDAWGNSLELDEDGCVSGASPTASAFTSRSEIERASDSRDAALGLHTGLLADERGYRIRLSGLLAPDTGYLAGPFADSSGSAGGIFLLAPAEAPQ